MAGTTNPKVQQYSAEDVTEQVVHYLVRVVDDPGATHTERLRAAELLLQCRSYLWPRSTHDRIVREAFS